MTMASELNPGRRPPLIAAADRVDRVIVLLCKTIVVGSGVALLGAITIGVVSRYVVTVGGADWAEELPKQIFAWFIMAGVVLATHGGNHIAVDLIHGALPERIRAALIVGTNLLIAVAYIYLGLVAQQVAGIVALEINPILGTPGSIPYWALTGGSFLIALSALSIALRVTVLGSAAAPQGKAEDSVQ